MAKHNVTTQDMLLISRKRLQAFDGRFIECTVREGTEAAWEQAWARHHQNQVQEGNVIDVIT